VAGVMATYWVTGALARFQLPVAPIPGLQLDLSLEPNGLVMAYSVIVVVATGLLFGLVPALRATRTDLVTDLKDETGTDTPGRSRTQNVLVAAQMAGTIVLLVGSGLFLRAVISARTLDMGFRTDDVHVASFDLELAGRSSAESWPFYDELARRARTLPGVESAAVAGKLPLAGLSQMAPVAFEGVDPPSDRTGFTLANQSVSPGYFRTVGMPLLEGRDFTDADGPDSRPVVVVNQALADRMWPGRSALGRTVQTPGTTWEVVGVVATADYNRPNEDPRIFAYFPASRRPRTDMILHVKMAAGARPPLQEIRALASGLEPAAAVLSAGSLDSAVGIFLLPQRVGAWVTGLVGLFGLLLGSLGVYALTAFWVTTNIRQMGIRMALGADRGEVLWEVLRRGAPAPLVGGLVGLGGSLVLTSFLRAFLFGVSPFDPLTYGGVAAVLLAVSVVANIVPAVRAARLDPANVLRGE
jgi:predicted permease